MVCKYTYIILIPPNLFCGWEDLALLTLPLWLVCAVGAKVNVPNVCRKKKFSKMSRYVAG